MSIMKKQKLEKISLTEQTKQKGSVNAKPDYLNTQSKERNSKKKSRSSENLSDNIQRLGA